MARRKPGRRALGENPDWDQIRRQAKDLLKGARGGARDALLLLIEHVPRLQGLAPEAVAVGAIQLADAQLALARSYGFASWPKLKCHVHELIARRVSDEAPSEHEVKTRVTTLDEMRVETAGDDCLVVIYAIDQADLGKRHVLGPGDTTVGRDTDNDIVVDVDSVSRRHARFERRGGGVMLVDLDSTNGTYVNDDVDPVRELQLRKGDHVKIGSTIFKYLAGTDLEAQYHEAIFNMIITDGLTDVGNRKQLDLVLAKEIPRAHRHGRALSLILLDVDHFKAINDHHGHLAGDAVLHELAAVMQRRLRPDDELGRYGGEEFCAILPETPGAGARAIAEDLRALVQQHVFRVEGETIDVTISLGVAELADGMDTKDLYRAADRKLYAAKQEGRNRVCA